MMATVSPYSLCLAHSLTLTFSLSFCLRLYLFEIFHQPTTPLPLTSVLLLFLPSLTFPPSASVNVCPSHSLCLRALSLGRTTTHFRLPSQFPLPHSVSPSRSLSLSSSATHTICFFLPETHHIHSRD
ncbi:hypothetical protein I3842_15G142300 [Carya illinoinensis]|uniref:Uncharacterized protein n=1 Tax=Carya illinoinensis TaxID=32201 RepID=A0A922DBR6_CARIL|nr:hypothetical protein I3842_15G142300 [Carya illinoinensis]